MRQRCCAANGSRWINAPISPPSNTTCYALLAIPGRSAVAVRKRLYVMFPEGMSEAEIREHMRASLEDWGPEAARTYAMDLVDESTAAPVSTGKRRAHKRRSANFVS